MIRQIIRWFFRDILEELQAIRRELEKAPAEEAPMMGMPMRKYEPLKPLGPLTGR